MIALLLNKVENIVAKGEIAHLLLLLQNASAGGEGFNHFPGWANSGLVHTILPVYYY